MTCQLMTRLKIQKNVSKQLRTTHHHRRPITRILPPTIRAKAIRAAAIRAAAIRAEETQLAVTFPHTKTTDPQLTQLAPNTLDGVGG